MICSSSASLLATPGRWPDDTLQRKAQGAKCTEEYDQKNDGGNFAEPQPGEDGAYGSRAGASNAVNIGIKVSICVGNV